MSTITSLVGTDGITTANSMTKINTNFTNLNTDKIETSVLDTDTTLAANSDAKIATQKAVKAYVDAGGNVNASTTTKGIVEEATQAEINAGTAAGGTGARLFINPSTVVGSNIVSKVANGATTYDLSTASGVQNIAHGLTVAPRLVHIYIIFSDQASATTGARINFAMTTYNGTTQASLYGAHNSSNGATGNYSDHGALFKIYGDINGNKQQAGVVTVDATNIIITWTKTNLPTGTANIVWDAIA